MPSAKKLATDSAPETSAPAATAAKQRGIQRETDATDKAKPKKGGGEEKSKKAVQAGARKQPELPYPTQHLDKPGSEAKLSPAPQFLAPDYRGSGKLDGFATLITGGDSGIGRAVAVLFAREGADVAIAYLDEHEDAEETKRHVEAEGRRCVLLPGDVKDAGYCRAAVEATVQAFGKLDVLVNNAAFQLHAESIETLTEEHWDETLRTNIYGYFHMAKAAVPHLKRGGTIINTGSETALFGSKDLLDYSATKGAIHAFTMALASNLVEKGIRVNCVAPGPVWTPLNPADKQADKVATFGQKTSMGRPAQPEEISPAYVFLASPVCSGFITGLILPILGGPK